jgi:hypothetical protein
MLTRTMAATLLPGRRWLRAPGQMPRTVWARLDGARQHSLHIQRRVELERERCIQRYGRGARR